MAPPRRRDCPFEASDAQGRAVEETIKTEAARRVGCVVGAAARRSVGRAAWSSRRSGGIGGEGARRSPPYSRCGAPAAAAPNAARRRRVSETSSCSIPHKQARFNKTRPVVPIEETGPRGVFRGFKTPPAAGLPLLQARVAAASALAGRGTASNANAASRCCAAARALNIYAGRGRASRRAPPFNSGPPGFITIAEESSARRRQNRVLRRAQFYEALDVASARALRRWRLIVASRKSTRPRGTPPSSTRRSSLLHCASFTSTAARSRGARARRAPRSSCRGSSTSSARAGGA